MHARFPSCARWALSFLLSTALLPVLGQTPAPTWQWAKNTGSTQMGETTAHQTATTLQGHTYVLGTFNGQVNFGSASFQPVVGAWPASGGDVFLAKYDSAGQLLWARQIGGTNEDRPGALATDALGNAYVGVNFASGRVLLAGDTLLNAGGDSIQGYGEFYDALLAKIDGAGQWQWVRQIGGRESDAIGGIAVDGAGNVYVAGSLQETDTVGTFRLATETYVAKLDGSGQWLWAATGGNTDGGGGAYALALNPTGTVVYVGGDFMNQGRFGTTVLTSTVSSSIWNYDGYVAALDAATGQWQWAKQIEGNGEEFVTALASDASGAVIIGGEFNGDDVTMDTATYANQVDWSQGLIGGNSFVAALSATGQWLWSNVAGSSAYNALTGLVAGPAGEVYVTGMAEDSARFGTSVLTWPIADYNSYLARLDGATGTWQWAVPLNEVPACGCGHLASQYAGVAMSANGTLRLTGTYTDSARFGALQLVGPLFFSNGSGQQQGYVVGFSDVLPLLLQLSPSAGTVGTSVTLTGQRLGAATQVFFNGVPASFTVVSPTQITVTVPPGATTGVVSVTTPAGTVNSPVVFRVGPTGLAEAGERAFSLWPNPAHASVRLTLAAPGAGEVEVRDALGRTVTRQPLAVGQVDVTLSLSGLPAGLYSVRVGNAARKLVVQ